MTEIRMDSSITALALGMFDGVHIGHRALLRKTAELALLSGGDPAVFTFSNHPAEAFGKRQILLTSISERNMLLRSEGMRHVITVPFTKEFASKQPDEFLAYLMDALHPRFLICGFNYTFGAGGKGDASFLDRESGAFGYGVCEVPPVLFMGRPVSSSRIRVCVESGRMEEASVMLGRNYLLKGFVDASGIFTPDASRAVPAEGSYDVSIRFGDGIERTGKACFKGGKATINVPDPLAGSAELVFLPV